MSNPEVESLLDHISYDLYGITRTSALNLGICIRCKKHVEDQTDDEYGISGLCPNCQLENFLIGLEEENGNG